MIGREPALTLTRAPAAETAGRVTIGFVHADLDYVAGAAEALAPDAAEPRTEQSALPVVLSEGQAKATAERALSEARIGRDSLSCNLPLSRLSITPGDVVSLEDGDHYRIDRIEDIGHRAVSAVRVEPSVYAAPVAETRVNRPAAFDPAVPVDVAFIELPLLTGDEDPVAPHVAVAQMPWAGPIAIYASGSDYGYVLDREIRRPAVVGTLLDPLPAAQPGMWMWPRSGSGWQRGRCRGGARSTS